MDVVATVEELLVSAYLGAMSGWSLPALAAEAGTDLTSLATSLKLLVLDGRAQVRSTAYEVNPFILREAISDPEPQVAWLLDSPQEAWVYAGPALLAGRPELATYAATPYLARMRAGEAQLTLVYFDLPVLENYSRDPRFRVDLFEYSGSMTVADAAYFDPDFPDRNKVGLQTFGIGYRADDTRVVAVFLCYLAELSSQHQGLWKAYEVDEPCKVATDYYANAMGMFGGKQSLYSAILAEMKVINEMANAMGRRALFKNAYDERRPQGLHTLLRPTRRAYHEFVAVLDKLLSDNIDLRFFRKEVARRFPDGTPKGSITMLEDWLEGFFRHRGEEDPVPTVIRLLRQVRQERREPAHLITEDIHDLSYFSRHDQLVQEVYVALRYLRLILTYHSDARGVHVPDWLARGDIGLY